MTPEMEKLVVKVAKAYLATKKATMKTVAEKFGVSESTVGKYLNKTLAEVDPELWVKVQEKKKANVARSHQNVAPKKPVAPVKKPTPKTATKSSKCCAKKATPKKVAKK